MNSPFNVVLMLLYDFSQIRSNKKHIPYHSFKKSAKQAKKGNFPFSTYFVPNRRSPASPRPGTI